MCGIVGAVAQRNIVPILLEGLQRLEYRGYDSAGLVVIQDGQLQRERSTGRVADLRLKTTDTHGTRTFLTERGKLDQFNRSWGHTLHNRFDEAVDDLRTAYEAEVPAGIREQLRAKDLLPPFYK